VEETSGERISDHGSRIIGHLGRKVKLPQISLPPLNYRELNAIWQAMLQLLPDLSRGPSRKKHGFTRGGRSATY
jgi:hypothetical protein